MPFAQSSLAQWVAAIATSLAVFLALFKDVILRFVFPPKLKLALVRPEGEKQTVRVQSNGQEKQHPARYYYLEVSNSRRAASPAQDTQVYLTRVEQPGGPDKRLQVRWEGNTPMRWRDQEIHPLQRKIGPAFDCDLCMVTSTGHAQIMPLIAPLYLPTQLSPNSEIVLSLQARCVEMDSASLRVRIWWDGKWEDGDKEMAQHFIVEPYAPEAT
jgi:hypothetical protein